MQTTIEQPEINQDLLEFLEYKRFKDAGGSIADLTYPLLAGNNPYCLDNNNLLREGLSMAGVIRTNEVCPVCKNPYQLVKQCTKCAMPSEKITKKKCECGGKYQIVETPIICTACRTKPDTYYFDFPWNDSGGGYKRFKYYRDYETGMFFDSWGACRRFAEFIRREMVMDGFDPARYLKVDINQFKFQNYAWAWYDRTCKTVAPSTKNTWKTILKKYLIPQFDGRDIRKIITGEIEDFAGGLTVSKNYKKDILTVLRVIYAGAKRRGELINAPDVPIAKSDKTIHDWLNADDQAKVFSKLPEHDKPIFEFLMLTGCRPGEARALKKDSIFFKDRLIIIKRTYSYTEISESPKDNEWRPVPMSIRVVEILQQQIKANRFTDFVFVNRLGKPYSRHLHRKWDKACEEAGVKKITMYQGTKHSFFTQKRNEGHSLDDLAEIAGHSSTHMTRVYGKMMIDNLRPIMEKKRGRTGRSSTERPDPLGRAYK